MSRDQERNLVRVGQRMVQPDWLFKHVSVDPEALAINIPDTILSPFGFVDSQVQELARQADFRAVPIILAFGLPDMVSFIRPVEQTRFQLPGIDLLRDEIQTALGIPPRECQVIGSTGSLLLVGYTPRRQVVDPAFVVPCKPELIGSWPRAHSQGTADLIEVIKNPPAMVYLQGVVDQVGGSLQTGIESLTDWAGSRLLRLEFLTALAAYNNQLAFLQGPEFGRLASGRGHYVSGY